MLNKVFQLAHGGQTQRILCPAFFIFMKAISGRDVEFKGLAVPSGRSIPPNEDLVAIWKVKDGHRFQNYRGIFTILDIPTITRKWINDLIQGNILTENCPEAYRLWIETGQFTPLQALRTQSHRTKDEQLPASPDDSLLLKSIFEHFQKNPIEFEWFASEIVKMADRNILNVEVTRPTRDGGRDGIGKYKIGTFGDTIEVDFALEAKCYNKSNSVGVKETSRLISRLRHRQFGVLVTTSYVGLQAYKEIKEDNHPIVIISGRNIIEILSNNSLGNISDLRKWLNSRFPI